MKIKNFFMFMAMAAVALTSCNKDNDGGGDFEGENYSLFMKFEGLDGTKAETSPIQDQTKATFTSGRMFFTKADGSIVRTVEISTTPGAVTPQQLQDGKLFEDVHKDVYEVYVVGNHNFPSNTNYSNISEVKALKVDIFSQTNNTTWGVENANLYGSGLVVTATAASGAVAAGADKEAVFEVTPLLARLEIDQFIGADNILEYTVDDIFIHNFYEEMAITSDLPATTPPAIYEPWRVSGNIQDWTKYAPTPSPGEYDPAYAKYLFDYQTNIAATPSLIAKPTPAGNLWAYNVLANAGAEPHIVIKLSNVKLDPATTAPITTGDLYDGQAGPGIAYLTIVGYNAGGGRTSILGGNIYKMDAIRFNDTDLGETPYPDDDLLKLWVKVTVKKWTVIPVTPIFNN